MLKKKLLPIVGLLVIGITLLACSSAEDDGSQVAKAEVAPSTAQTSTAGSAIATATPTPLEPITTPTSPVPVATVIAPVAATMQGSGTLVVVLLTETGNSPKSGATVSVFATSDGLMTDESATEEGVYRTMLPSGHYDIVVTHHSKPQIGYLQKGFTVEDDNITTAQFTVPPEGALRVLVQTQNGDAPKQNHVVRITSGETAVTSISKSADYSESTFTLRTDLTYGVTVEYGDDELQETAVSIQEEGTEIEFVLPYDEGTLKVLIRAEDESLAEQAEVTVLNSTGKTVHKRSVENEATFILHANEDYTVRVQYQDRSAQERIVRVSSGGVLEETFTFNP